METVEANFVTSCTPFLLYALPLTDL